ncbi:hypothetical protein C8Q72DRAFT_207486 [Fomitopsis betulina]|nr:hypothetical protein C8Q72DRAFT_207486 [Fomitopsis betulina]
MRRGSNRQHLSNDPSDGSSEMATSLPCLLPCELDLYGFLRTMVPAPEMPTRTINGLRTPRSTPASITFPHDCAALALRTNRRARYAGGFCVENVQRQCRKLGARRTLQDVQPGPPVGRLLHRWSVAGRGGKRAWIFNTARSRSVGNEPTVGYAPSSGEGSYPPPGRVAPGREAFDRAFDCLRGIVADTLPNRCSTLSSPQTTQRYVASQL